MWVPAPDIVRRLQRHPLTLAALIAATLASHTPAALVAPRQEGAVIELAGQSGGLLSTLVDDGRYAYIGVGPRVAVLDLSARGDLRPVAWSEVLPGPALDLAVTGDRLVVAGGVAGLMVLDLAGAPPTPRLIGRVSLAGAVYEVVASGEHAFAASGSQLAVVALTGPGAPRVAHAVEMGTRVSDDTTILALHGGRLFMGFRKYGVGVVDVSDPERAFVAGWNEDLPCTTLAAGDGFVAVFGSVELPDHTFEDSLTILDLEPREFLRPVGQIPVDGGLPVESMTATGRALYLRWHRELQLLSLADLAQPVVEHRVALPPRGGNSGLGLNQYRPRQILDTGGRLYVVHNGGFDQDNTRSGVLVFDLNAQSGLRAAGGWLEDLPADVLGAASAGGYLVLRERLTGALRLFRVRADGSLERLGALPQDWGTASIAVDPPWLYFADLLTTAPSLYAIDIVDPARPALAAKQAMADFASPLVTRQGRAFVAQRVSSELGGKVTDIEVRRPAPDGSIPLTGLLSAACTYPATDLALAANRLLIACRQDGLMVADVTDPDRPRRLSQVPTNALAMAVTGNAHHAFVATRWPTPPEERDVSPAPHYGGLRIVDLNRLTEIGTLRLKLDRAGNAAWDVAIIGLYTLVTYSGRSVLVFDVTDPTQPTLAEDVALPTEVGELVQAGDTVYVTGRNGGLYLLRWRVDPGAGRAEGVYLPFATVRRRVQTR